jgi:predicted outer membrane lipoprotein
VFQPTGSDHSAFWFEHTDAGQWDGEVGRACQAAVEDWKRFQHDAEDLLGPVIPNQRLRHRLSVELADHAFPEAFSPACRLWLEEEEALSRRTLKS